jgi:hypothetical protein
VVTDLGINNRLTAAGIIKARVAGALINVEVTVALELVQQVTGIDTSQSSKRWNAGAAARHKPTRSELIAVRALLGIHNSAFKQVLWDEIILARSVREARLTGAAVRVYRYIIRVG